MAVAHPVTPIGSPCEPFLNAVCGLRGGYFLFADKSGVVPLDPMERENEAALQIARLYAHTGTKQHVELPFFILS
jgi:hypothetical protein